MREILFRGKSPVTNEWIIGYLFNSRIRCNEVNIIIPQCSFYDLFFKDKLYQVLSPTVCQYTGITDKSGAKIFEHDIISAHLDDLFPENETRLVVIWHDYGFFGINPRYIDYTQYQVDLITMITSQQSEMKDVLFDSLENEFVKKFEVIGNIYDNPELLK